MEREKKLNRVDDFSFSLIYTLLYTFCVYIWRPDQTGHRSSVQFYLYGEMELVVDGSEVVGDLSCGLEVRGALKQTSVPCRRARGKQKKTSASRATSRQRHAHRTSAQNKNKRNKTSRPTTKEWSSVPNFSAASVLTRWRLVTEATREESSPPERRTPKGTSVISLLITACTHARTHAARPHGHVSVSNGRRRLTCYHTDRPNKFS